MSVDDVIAKARQELRDVSAVPNGPDEQVVASAMSMLRAMYDAAPLAGVKWEQPSMSLSQDLSMLGGPQLQRSVIMKWSDGESSLSIIVLRFLPHASPVFRVKLSFIKDKVGHETVREMAITECVSIWKTWGQRL